MRRWLAAAVAVVMATAWACGGDSVGDPPPVTGEDPQKPGNGNSDAGTPDAGNPTDTTVVVGSPSGAATRDAGALAETGGGSAMPLLLFGALLIAAGGVVRMTRRNA